MKSGTRRKSRIAAATALLLLLAAGTASAFPPIAAEFYGSVHTEGNPAPPGTSITITDSDSTLCGQQTTKEEGIYGLLSCNGDDPSTERDEGAQQGESVTIAVNGRPAATAVWREGQLLSLDISQEAEPISARLDAGAPGGAFILLLFPATFLLALYLYARPR